MTWTAISYAYGDWNMEGEYPTKKEAMACLCSIHGMEEKAKKSGSCYELTCGMGSNHLIIKTKNLVSNGYTPENKA